MYPSELHLGPTIQFRPGPSLIEYYKLNGLTKSQDIGYVEENHQPRWQLAVMGQIVRDGLTHGRCFRYRIAFVLKNTIITFNDWLMLAHIFQIFLFSRLSSCPPNMVELSMSKEKWLRSSRCKNEFSIICVKCHSKFARIYCQGRMEVVLNYQIQVNRNSDGNPFSALISNPSGDKEASFSTAWHHHHYHHK